MVDRKKPSRRLSLTFAGSVGDLDIISTIEDIPLPFDDLASEENMIDLESMAQKLNNLLGGETTNGELSFLNSDIDEFSSLLENEINADSSTFALNDSSMFISGFDEWVTDDENKGGKQLRRNSLLVAGRISRPNSLALETDPNSTSTSTKMKRRDSFLVAKDILGMTKDRERTEKQGKRLRRNSLLINNKAIRRNSFLFSMDSLDLPEITANDRRNSLLLASKILGLQNDDFGRSITQQNSVLSWNKMSRKERRNSLLLASKILGLQNTKESSLASTKMIHSIDKEDDKKKRKSNSICDLFESSLTAMTVTEGSNAGECSHRRVKRRLSILPAVRKDPTISSKQNPENSLSLQLPIVPNKIDICHGEITSIAQSACSKLLSLGQAMKSSEESQIRIHDWDKKMGLRRSHSKTMRNSMRSRKRLLQVCSGEMFTAML